MNSNKIIIKKESQAAYKLQNSDFIVDFFYQFYIIISIKIVDLWHLLYEYKNKSKRLNGLEIKWGINAKKVFF